MRSTLLACPILAATLLLPAPAGAQQRPKIHIDQVRVGFPHGERNLPPNMRGLFKPGSWTPVFVDLTAGDETIDRGDITVESNDSDAIPNNYSVPLPRMEPRDQATVIAYTRPGARSNTISVRVRANGREVVSREDYEAIELHDSLYLTLGSTLGGLRRTTTQENKENEAEEKMDVLGARQHVCSLTSVAMMPNRWYAYAPLDLVILATGNRDPFLNDLLNERENRKQALAEWVRRGGRLVVSAGGNHDVVAKLLDQMAMSDAVAITGAVPGITKLDEVGGWLLKRNQNAPAFESRPLKDGKVPPIPVAKLEVKPGREVEQFVPPPGEQDQKSPLLMVRFPHGLGQVTIVAFDLDRVPFVGWQGQADFWKQLLQNISPPTTAAVPNQQVPNFGAQNSNEPEDIAGTLQGNLEIFGDVPVISFGWVALFIFVYILIVGPLDYFFLKKVVKRLELTWITFPTVVLLVSAAAYFAAYALKGNDQKVNKIDVIDFDLASGQLYGHSWFTIFSPRIQHYTVGIEPAAPTWAETESAEQPASPVTVTWLGRPDANYGGVNSQRSPSLFRQAYDYATNATGLRGVPIQVWSSKSFTASWERPLGEEQLPFAADLRRPAGSLDKVEGSITSRLGESGNGKNPLTLEQAALLFGDVSNRGLVIYPLGTLTPGAPLPIKADHATTSQQTWMQRSYARPVQQWNQNAVIPSPAQVTTERDWIIRDMLFHQADPNKAVPGNSLRQLDQSWRLHLKDQAMLVGRLAHQEGSAEDIARDPASASRLWLGALPGSGARPSLSGKLTQDTYVRVFLPISNR